MVFDGEGEVREVPVLQLEPQKRGCFVASDDLLGPRERPGSKRRPRPSGCPCSPGATRLGGRGTLALPPVSWDLQRTLASGDGNAVNDNHYELNVINISDDDDDDDDDDDHETSPHYNHAKYLDTEKVSLRPRCIQQY